MSDFARERRQRARAGSLLDHADSAPVEPVLQRGERVASTPEASLLSVQPRKSPRISTSRFATPQTSVSENPTSDPVAVEEPQGADPGGGKHAGGGFGDRISQLIGKVAPRPGEAVQAHHRHSVKREDQRPEQETPTRQRFAEFRDASPSTGSRVYGQRPQPAPEDTGPSRSWASSSPEFAYVQDSRPLLDASILMAAVWRFRYLIGLITIAGAIMGVLMALATPHKYYAESRLFLDPREIRLTEDDVRNQQLSTEAMLAIIDSQLQILSSTNVLQKVIDDLGLERDPEFNGSLPSTGIGAGINLIRELVSGRDPASDATQVTLEELRDSLSVSRDSKTFVIIVGVNTRDPEKSALIANKVVDTYLDSEGEAQSGLLERTSESIDTRLNALREDLDEAERAVERFKAENGIVGVAGQYIDDKEILAVSDQLANARAAKVGIRVKAQNLAKANPEDVLSGAFPEEYLSSNLVNLRKQYAQTKSTADALATQLGPRHPQYVTAKSSLDTTRSEIIAELRRIVASSQLELQRAVETEQELASQMAVAKSRAMDQSVEFVTLRELERKATATREIYEAFLKRSRETSERSNLSTRNVRVISPAEPPLKPTGPSRKLIAVGGMVVGFLAGLGLALLFGAVESIRSHGGPGQQRRVGTMPFDPDPGAPDPGRRGVPDHMADAESFRAAADYDTSPLARGGALGSRAGLDQTPPAAQASMAQPTHVPSSLAAGVDAPASRESAALNADAGASEARPAPAATPVSAPPPGPAGFEPTPAPTVATHPVAPNTTSPPPMWPYHQPASIQHPAAWQTQIAPPPPGYFAHPPAPHSINGQYGFAAPPPTHFQPQPQPQPQPQYLPVPQPAVWPQQTHPAAWPQPTAPAMPPQANTHSAPQSPPMHHASATPSAQIPFGVQQTHPGTQSAHPAQAAQPASPQAAWQAVHSQPAVSPSAPAPAAQPQAVERIRRDMDALKSRIGDYRSARRRA